MVKSKSALLALIHQYLLKNGYGKAARELQLENGENFATTKITLQRVYKLWTKKSKKKKKTKRKEEAKHKKQDHDSKKAEHLDLALQAKKSSGTKAKKAKQVKKKMNLATEAAADVKVNSKKTPKKASSSLNDNPGSSVTQAADVFPDGNYSSVSKKKTASANAASIQAASLKSKLDAEKSNESSSSSETEEETTKQVVRGKKIPVSAAAEQKSLGKPSNGKAEVSESSDDSDETDIDKLPAPVTSKPTVPSSQQASKGKRQAALPVQKVQADSSTESSETDEEEEPVKQVVTPTPKLASPPTVSAAKLKAKSLLPALQSVKAESSESDSEEEPVKQDKTPAKAVKALPTKPTKGLGKATTPAQANASAVKVQLQSEILVTESDSSDSEEQQKTPSAITSKIATASLLTPLVAAKDGMPIKTVLPLEETSEEESSDSDEESTTKTPATVISTPQQKTLSMGIKQTPVVAAKTPLKSSQPADESSEEESTDSDETSVKKPGTVLQASQSKTPVVESKQTLEVAKSKSPSKAPQPSNESSEESDSDGEPVAKKPATVHLSQPKTPSGGAKQASVLAKTQSPAKTTPQSDESSEESDSDEESAAKKPTTAVQLSQLKTPSGGAKQTTLKATPKTPLKTAQLDSESSEESDTDEETVAKETVTALQSTQPKSPSGDPKQTAVIAKSKTSQPNSESSEEESDSDEEAVAKTTPAVQVKMPASALTVKPTFVVQVPDSDADSESSESDTERKQCSKSTAPVKVPENTPVAVAKMVTKPTAADASDSSDSDDEEKAQPKPSAVSRGVKGKQTVSTALKPDESSEESESESDEPVKPAEVKTLETQKAKLSASQPKTTAQPATPKGKSLVTSKVTTVSQAMADSSESTESSDNEDLPPAQVPNISVKATPPAAKFTVQPAAVAKHKAGSPTKSVPGTKLAAVNQGTSDSSESSDNEEEQPGAQNLVFSVEAKQKKKPMSAPLLTSTPYESTVSKGKGAVPASTHPVAKKTDISESSDTESDEEETTQVVTPTPSFVKSKSVRVTDKLAKTSTSSNAAIAKSTTPFKVPPTLKKDPAESSSESSDSESSEETALKVNTPVPTAVKAAQPKVSGKVKTPNVTSPVPGKTNANSQRKQKQVNTDRSSESSNSKEEPVVKIKTKSLPKPTEQSAKAPLPSTEVKGKATSLTRSPVVEKPATADTSSSSSESDEDPVIKPPAATPKPAAQPSVRKTTTQSPAVLQKQESSSEESDSDEEEPVKKPPAATPKPAAQPSVGKTTTQSPAVLQKKQKSSSEESDSDEEEPVKKPTAATPKPAAQPTVRKATTKSPAVLQKQESSSEESDSEGEPVIKLTSSFGKTQKKPEPAANLTKLKSPLPVKGTVVTEPNDSPDTASSDSEEDRPVQDKGAATGNLTSSQKSVGRSVSKMSSTDVKKIKPAVPLTPSGGSKPKDSQTLLEAFFPVITIPKKRKKASKTTNILDSVAGKSKKKEGKNKVDPDTIPDLPKALPLQSPSAVALLESEEETVLALLEGRSPKKAKKNKLAKKAAETAVFDFATPLVQKNDVPKKSPLPQPFLSSTWVPESPTSGDDKSVQPTTELPSLSDKKLKSSKKRKLSQDLQKQNQKPAKKTKKEKKIQKGMAEEVNVTAKPKSDKKKSEKDRSNKKTKTKEKKENKEGKKKAESMAAAVVESADSGISLSKPKKKRKT